MASPPEFLAVSRCLPTRLHALRHVPTLVSSFLLPLTIDSAVYNRLHRVIQVFQASLPYTSAAMDGAAAKGFLDIIQWLHSNRSEGCSNDAFIGASSNNFLQVLKWLYEFYPENADPAKEIVVAAGKGHVPVVEFLLPKVRREQVKPALVAAAKNGQVSVLEVLVVGPCNVRKSFLAAAKNGQVEVLRFFLGKGYSDKYMLVSPALVEAAKCGHDDVVELLLERSDDFTTSEALRAAAGKGCTNVVALILERCQLSPFSVARALEEAGKRDQSDAVKMLFESHNCAFSQGVDTGDSDRLQLRSIIDLTFMSAVEHGRMNIVKPLIVAVSWSIEDMLVTAVSHNRLQMMEFLLDFFDKRPSQATSFRRGVGVAVETAASRDLMDMTKLLVAKCPSMDTRTALRMAVNRNHLDMLKLLVKISTSTSIIDAVVAAAVLDRMDMLNILLEHSNADAVEQALLRVASAGKDSLLALLIEKCNPRSYNRIVVNAAGDGLAGLVQLLLDKVNVRSIRCGLISAASGGYTETVSALMDGSDSISITCAFEMAVLKGHLDVVELLRDQCDPESVQFAVSSGDPDVVHLLRNKRARLG